MAEDIHTLRHEGSSFPRTAPARLLYGLRARFDNGGAPLAIVPCDNLPGNGSALRGALLDLADAAGVAEDLAAWLRAEVSFVNTSVDRITPRTTDADIAVVRDAGWLDAAPVVTEPFSDWVLSGSFPAGRPAWEQAGARFVDDIELFERRKLWLLNGAHTTLASAGTLRSLETVADAFADPHCRDLVEAFWADAALALPPEADAVSYVERLRQRFSARRMRHLLSQISQDAAAKSRVRILPVAQALGFDPRVASGCVAALASVAEATGEPVDSLLGQGDGSVAFLEFQAAVVDVAPVRNLL